MTRVVHCKREPHDVYIGRPGPWGNPYSHDPEAVAKGRAEYLVESREQAIELYRQWYEFRLFTALDVPPGHEDEFLDERIADLHGLTLGCWCAPRACHGDVLAVLAARLHAEREYLLGSASTT